MHTSSDLMLILDSAPASRTVLGVVAERLGCEHIEADSAGAGDVEQIVRAWPANGPAATGSWPTSKPSDVDICATTTMRVPRIPQPGGGAAAAPGNPGN